MKRFHISTYFFLVFFGFGAFYPMLGVYFEEIGLSGSQIGMIMSIGPIITIFTQPIWGMLSDRFQKPKLLLTLATFMAGMIVLSFLISSQYYQFILIMGFLAIFQSAIVPLSDSLTISYCRTAKVEYGTIRLWGAVGFALAVWVAGVVIEKTSTSIIFYLFATFLLLSSWFSSQMPSEGESLHIDLRSGLTRLAKIPVYVLFLLSSFIFLGTMHANNFYFGIYYTSIGGTVAGIGLVFLLAAGSEAPFMRVAGSMIRKLGLLPLLIVAASISAFRWFIFYLEPSTSVILFISILQGVTVGFYIPAGVEFVRQLTPADVKVTGMSLYTAIGTGLGTMFFTFIGGYIFEYYSIGYTYLFYALATLLSICVLLWIWRVERVVKGKG